MPDDRIERLCGLWWEKAQADLAAAERLTDLCFVSCFHWSSPRQAEGRTSSAIARLHLPQ